LRIPAVRRSINCLAVPLDVSHFLRIAIPLAGALRHVHERGLIHKDIKAGKYPGGIGKQRPCG